MIDGNDFHRLGEYPIDDPVVAGNDFTQRSVVDLRNDTARLGKEPHMFNGSDETLSKKNCVPR